MTVTDELLANNERNADQVATLLPSPPGKRVAIVTCMDARINPAQLLGLEIGDAHVIRNAGAVITDDVLRSLAISQRLLGTQEVVVILHSECGLLGFDAEAFSAGIETETGQPPGFPQASLSDLEVDAKAAVEKIRGLPYLPHTDSVRGFVVEIATGKLHEI